MSANTMQRMEMRDAFITRLYAKAQEDRDIVFLCNDYGAPSLDAFRETLPDQFFNMAISEQNMISVAAGLAMQGKKVFVYSIASFLVLRCLEQVKIDICCMRLPVTLIGVGTAYAYSADGPTHHATEDIAVMRALANLRIYGPPDAQAASLLVDVALKQEGPLYLRFDKGKYPVVYPDALPERGFSVLRQGSGLCLVATGTMTSRAMETADALAARGIDATVVDVMRIKPLDAGLGDVLGRHDRVMTIEEHSRTGGLGGAVAEFVADYELRCRLKRAAIDEDKLYAYGLRSALHEERGLSVGKLVETIVAWTA